MIYTFSNMPTNGKHKIKTCLQTVLILCCMDQEQGKRANHQLITLTTYIFYRNNYIQPCCNYWLFKFLALTGKSLARYEYFITMTYLAIGSLVSNQLFPNVAFTLKGSCIIDVDVSYLNLKQTICELYKVNLCMQSNCSSNIINLVL